MNNHLAHVRNEPATRKEHHLIGDEKPLSPHVCVSWCGVDVPPWEVFFLSIDHAANSSGGSLEACPECIEEIIDVLRNGSNPS